MKDITERVLFTIEKSGLDKKGFAERIGISASTLTHIANGRNKPSLELIMGILDAYPDISSEWLLRGRGVEQKNFTETSNASSSQELKDRLKLLKMIVTEHYRTEVQLLDDLYKNEY
jgi:transcriptional regulator with XRE-family HTH domain